MAPIIMIMNTVFFTAMLYAEKRKRTLCDPMGYTVHGMGIFPTQGLNPGLLHCRWILYQLSDQGNLRIPEWVAYSFSRGSSQTKDWTQASCIAGGFFTNWAFREVQGERGEWKSLKFNIKMPKIMASGPIISEQINREKVKAVTGFIYWWWLQPWN